MRLAGRCHCGVSMDLVAKKPDPHLICWGLRWCGVKGCGEAAGYRQQCLACKSRQTPAKRQRTRLWWQEQRRKGTAAYERDKARKRARYLTDPKYAAKQKRAA